MGAADVFFNPGEKREGEARNQRGLEKTKRLKPWHDVCLSRIVRLTLPARVMGGFWTGFERRCVSPPRPLAWSRLFADGE